MTLMGQTLGVNRSNSRCLEKALSGSDDNYDQGFRTIANAYVLCVESMKKLQLYRSAYSFDFGLFPIRNIQVARSHQCSWSAMNTVAHLDLSQVASLAIFGRVS